jgi:hypothetical protein
VGCYTLGGPNLSKLCVPCTFDFLISADEDIATNNTSTPIPVSTSTTPFGSITHARAHRLTHQVSSLLISGSSYLDNGDTCTLVLLRNNGLDQKGRGIAQAGFELQDIHDLRWPPRLHPDSVLVVQVLPRNLIKSTFQRIHNHLYIYLESTAIINLLQSPFSVTVLCHPI